MDHCLPWDFIDHGIYKEHRLKEYKLSLKGEESDICHVGDCIRCGVRWLPNSPPHDFSALVLPGSIP